MDYSEHGLIKSRSAIFNLVVVSIMWRRTASGWCHILWFCWYFQPCVTFLSSTDSSSGLASGYVVLKLAYFRVFQFLAFCVCLWDFFAIFPKAVSQCLLFNIFMVGVCGVREHSAISRSKLLLYADHTGWAKSRYTVINSILYTYFWPILYNIFFTSLGDFNQF